MRGPRFTFLLFAVLLGIARPAPAVLDASFFAANPSSPAPADAKVEGQAQESHPFSLTYTLDLSTTEQITHTTSISTGITQNLSLLADASYLSQTSQPSVYSGEIGFQDKLSELFNLKLMLTGNRTSVAPLTIGGNSTLDTMLSSLWDGRLHTRIQLGFGVSQIWDGGAGADPFGLDQTIYQLSESAGVFQEIAPQVEIGLSYSYFGYQNGQNGRDTYTFSIQSAWSPQFSTNFNLSAISDAGPQRSISFGGGFTFTAPSQHWSIGAHGSAFQQSATATDPSASTAATSPSRALSTSSGDSSGPSAPGMTLGFSGGLDIGFYW